MTGELHHVDRTTTQTRRIRTRTFGALVAILLAAIAALGADAQTYVDVSVGDGHVMWQQGVFVLDVRTTAEFRAGHIPGAHNIDVAELADRLDEIADLAMEDILVHCQAGGRSATASQLLADNGYTAVYNMLGGFATWQTAGYEVDVSDAGFDTVTLENAHRLWQGGALMVDVRSAYLYCAGHVTGACNIPEGKLAERLAELADWQEEDVVVYCASGSCGLSAAAAALLADNGFTRVHNMSDGYEAWAAAGYETESEFDGPPFSCHRAAAAIPPSSNSGDGMVLLCALALLCVAPRLRLRYR